MNDERRKLEFSQNWNGKLFTSNYTTIRLTSPKYQVGRYYDVYMGDQFCHTVKIVDISFFMIGELTEYVSRLDTGFNREDTINILKQFYPETDWTLQRLSLITVSRLFRPKKDAIPSDGVVRMDLFESRSLPLQISSIVDRQDFR